MPTKKPETAKKTTKKKAVKKSGVEGLEASMNALMEMLNKQSEAIAALQKGDHQKDAKNNPVVIRQAYETEEHETGNMEERVMEATGPAELSLNIPTFKLMSDGSGGFIKRMYSDDKMKLLRFMEDKITIEIHDTTDETQVYIPAVWNDGKAQYFMRNQPQEVKRKYVEVLARAKKTTYTQRKGKNFNGDDTIINVPHTALVFPFRILEDPAGIAKGTKGYEWHNRIQREQ